MGTVCGDCVWGLVCSVWRPKKSCAIRNKAANPGIPRVPGN